MSEREGRSDGRLGAQWLGSGRCRFVVWAPRAGTAHVHVVAPVDRLLELAPAGSGYFEGIVPGLAPGARYTYRLDDAREFPDPASRSQPDGVHAPSAVVPGDFAWTDGHWRGLPLDALVVYELHVGTFTSGGTFDAVGDHLPALADLGITAIEIMPVAQFPGSRNWGYDGVYPFAAQHSYGGVDGLKRLVDRAHAVGLAVLLDVVYNHLGPEGNYLGNFGPYFTDRYRTPWGQAIDFDGADSGGVRRFVVENAVEWVRDYHLDGLRLDAVHGIFDASPRHILTELTEAVREATPEREVHVIAESDQNDARLVTPVAEGGLGIDAQWSDDFHHALHAVLTGETAGYYLDFGRVEHLAAACRDGFVYAGQHSPYRGRPHGTSPHGIPGRRLVICAQNHDQIGNRMLGERLGHLVSFAHLKVAAGALLTAPFVPLLFMGQEYADTAPFLYFVSHGDPALVEAVRRGRRNEFSAFAWRGEVPDPQAVGTLERSRLDHRLATESHHRVLRDFHRELLRLRRAVPALATLDKRQCHVTALEEDRLLVLHRRAGDSEAAIVLAFGQRASAVGAPVPRGEWQVAVDSGAAAWLGSDAALTGEVGSDGVLTLGPSGPRVIVLTRQRSRAVAEMASRSVRGVGDVAVGDDR